MSELVDALLNFDNDRAAMAHTLGESHQVLTDAMRDYRAAYRAATAAGWAKTDLSRAGFIDPARLPRVKQAGKGASHNDEQD